jgi:hypothetical protein
MLLAVGPAFLLASFIGAFLDMGSPTLWGVGAATMAAATVCWISQNIRRDSARTYSFFYVVGLSGLAVAASRFAALATTAQFSDERKWAAAHIDQLGVGILGVGLVAALALRRRVSESFGAIPIRRFSLLMLFVPATLVALALGLDILLGWNEMMATLSTALLCGLLYWLLKPAATSGFG